MAVESAGTEEGVTAALMELPWLVEVPAAVLLREAVRLKAPVGLRTLALSVKWEQRLERAAIQLRRSSPSAAAFELLRLAWRDRSEKRRPYSLGGYAVLLRKRGHSARRKQRGAKR